MFRFQEASAHWGTLPQLWGRPSVAAPTVVAKQRYANLVRDLRRIEDAVHRVFVGVEALSRGCEH